MPKTLGVAAVDRALAILSAFSANQPALSLHDIAERTDLHKSTILRLLASLEAQHCVIRRDDDKYQLGPMLLHWGSLYLGALRLEDHIVPALQRLSRDTGESASFYTRENGMRVCLFRVDSPRSVRDHVRVGDLLPLDRGAAGHVLTKFDPSNPEMPESPIVITFGEQDPDAAGVAAPIFAAGNILRGAISLSGPMSRFTQAVLPRMSEVVTVTALELTNRLGGNTACFERNRASKSPEAQKPQHK